MAEELAPDNDDVLGALGRAHRLEGRTALAIDYLERAVSIAPTRQHRLSLEAARLSYEHRIETVGRTSNSAAARLTVKAPT